MPNDWTSPCSNPSAARQVPEISDRPKRRKIRKGTQSCWECKRRKIRCTFAAPTVAVCDGCRSRRTKCISQEYDDAAALENGRSDRLSRVESLVEKLVNRDAPNVLDSSRRDHPDQDQENLPALVAASSPDLESQKTNDLDDVSRALIAVWPNQHDLDLILSISVGVSVLFHGVICQSYSRLFREITSTKHMLQPPLQGTHPALIARKLLLLASLMQGIPTSSASRLVDMSSDYRVVMSRIFSTATRLVTSNDELTNSLEGIICIMIESMYLNNAGNLRRAWLANRKAMATAQMLGLHAGISSPRMDLEKETRDRIDPNYMWFRLVVTDRYLSLMLGLPQGSLETAFTNLETPDSCVAVERLERTESVAASLILQRNSAERTDLAATHRIDKMLQEAAALMPPQWWLMTPEQSTTIAGSDAKAFEESIRLANHFAYNHLLVQLHLPYMMQPSSIEPSYDYSKMTAANASRTIIAQYVSFRNSLSATAYCRGIDFIAFIASTTLCIAHIEACRQQRANVGKCVTVLQSLQHQRPSDRGLLERTLEAMEVMAQNHDDVVAQKVSSILRPLLAIEDNSFSGARYHMRTSSEADSPESRSLGDTTEAFHALHVQIPYFGTVQIEHDPDLPETTRPSPSILEEQPWNSCASSATRPAGYAISTSQPVNTDWQAVPSPFESRLAGRDQHSSPTDTSGAHDPYLLVPGLSVDVDDWALQGVDMALFSNLMHSSASSSGPQ
ncbi:hypothetical protein GGR52DRAFT_579065 [Hypoxylon sp. FL1284]|nr:hypothetical protein GGR52DRAFT_579065 [Hypoxylon sp. FL1284]